jgi:hypothetical protein
MMETELSETFVFNSALTLRIAREDVSATNLSSTESVFKFLTKIK